MIRYALMPLLVLEVWAAIMWPWLLWYYGFAIVVGGLATLRLWWFMHTYAAPRPWWPVLKLWLFGPKLPRATARRRS